MNNPEKQATLGTRHKTKTIQRNRQHWAQDTKQRQSRETGNIGHKTQNKDKQNTTWKSKEKASRSTPKTWDEPQKIHFCYFPVF